MTTATNLKSEELVALRDAWVILDKAASQVAAGPACIYRILYDARRTIDTQIAAFLGKRSL